MRLAALARALGAQLQGPDREIQGLASLEEAGPQEIAGYFERRWRPQALQSCAAALICSPELLEEQLPVKSLLLVERARDAWGEALRLLHPQPTLQPPPPGISPQALLAEDAWVHPEARIAPRCILGPEVRVAAHCILHPGVQLGAGVSLAEGCLIHPGALILDGCQLGARVWVGAGAVIGAQGFGLDVQGRVPHRGRVFIGDDVSLGALSCVARGTLGETRIEAGAHLDSLVMVGHNSYIGPGALLCAQVGLAGGACVEAGAVLGGQAGVAGYRRVGRGAQVAAQSGVTRDLAPGGRYSGHPAEPNRRRLKRLARLKRLLEPR